MSKIVIEDIKKNHRSLREVIPSRRDHESDSSHRRKTPVTSDLASKKKYRHDDSFDTSSGLGWLWGAIVVTGVVVVIGYFIAPIFTKVTIVISPKEVSVQVDEKMKAVRDATSNQLTFTVLPAVEKTVSLSVPATGNKYVETKASGKIRISNNFSADPQALVATTRFTSAKGKVYRIAQNVTVPGMKAGKPGTIETTVYADKAGADYNDALTTFTIPGFAGSPKFSKITAQSVTPMTGGGAGNVKAVDPSAEATVRKQISDQLKSELTIAVQAQLPDGFFTTNDLISFNYQVNQQTQTGQPTTNAVFVGQGRAVAVIFNENTFANQLANQILPTANSQNNQIKVTNLDQLSIAITPAMLTSELEKAASIDLHVVGKPNLLWQIDQTKLAGSLAGQPKNAFADVFKSYCESIVSGEVVFHPSWSNRFPDDQNRISIELLTPNKTPSP